MAPIFGVMKASAKSSASKSGRRTAKAVPTYRGVVLQPTPGPTRFTHEQLEKAVDAAFAKNADALANRFKS
jgi:hypothetical protein